MLTAKRFWVLDFDRCLGDTQALYGLFVDILQERGVIDAGVLSRAREEMEAGGGSFDIVTYLLAKHLIDTDECERLAVQYVERALMQPGGMLGRGAKEFLQYLKQSGQPFGIMTYGNPRWQRLKIKASGLAAVPCLIVPHKRKGSDIAGWYSEEVEKFALPGGLAADFHSADEVILVDDKATAFTGLPERARGYWLQLDENLLASQRGRVSSHVRVAKSFEEIMMFEASVV